MALPDSCELTQTHLVFWELASEAQLIDTEKLYEFCCTVACTNALRPLRHVEVVRHSIPDLADGQVLLWGNRQLTAEAGRDFERFWLCVVRTAPSGAANGLPGPPWGAHGPAGGALRQKDRAIPDESGWLGRRRTLRKVWEGDRVPSQEQASGLPRPGIAAAVALPPDGSTSGSASPWITSVGTPM